MIRAAKGMQDAASFDRMKISGQGELSCDRMRKSLRLVSYERFQSQGQALRSEFVVEVGSVIQCDTDPSI